MIEIFKTNVTERDQANRLVELIHKQHAGYKANFDLDDRDHILRVENKDGIVHSHLLIHLLKESGFNAEVLPDIVASTSIYGYEIYISKYITIKVKETYLASVTLSG